MTYKTILIDDEPLALQRLQRLLAQHKDAIEIMDCADNGPDAVQKINEQKPDLIFLDIQMPELDGFEVLNRVDHLPLVIFSTAYDEYALRAFETNSIDYLLKPVDTQRLEKAVRKLQRLDPTNKLELQQQLQNLISKFKPASTRLQVRVGDRIRFLDVDEIYFFEADEKYVSVHTYDETILISKSLQQLESELPAEDFVRVHRSAIINLNHVAEFVKWFSGTYRVRMRDKKKTKLPVSRKSRTKLGLV
ncbi:response regulator transcription factor [candidate division KSB1 bacterium]|nr:response regulator transcription factor [candidate division KSB1 bacterium]NIR70029.1 response regulator transcription factor [candidate division KSB1 bacterium]NIS23927.1 response regulator transcription factor [candidate division KSB1 bacterium]NIT70844.1 response regulator transcription factor [candidate division KSB1 bacterium]NIU24575.1 response regulator transcription factor [candidate division KSB1 bacterium]